MRYAKEYKIIEGWVGIIVLFGFKFICNVKASIEIMCTTHVIQIGVKKGI